MPGSQFPAGFLGTSEDGELRVSVDSPVDRLGRVLTANPTPIVQLDFSYGLPTGFFIGTNSLGAGTIVGQRGYGEVSNGDGNIGSYGALFSQRVLRTRDGQGMEAYFAAKFDDPQAGVVQLLGAFTAEDGFALGFGFAADGITPTDEPVLFIKSGGVRQVETLTLSGSPGAGTVDISLGGGAAVTVTLSGGPATLADNAWEISEATFPGWRAYALDETVIFIRDSVGSVAIGTYTSASGSPASGSFATTTAGETGTDTWIERSSWVDPLDGSGPSKWEVPLTDWHGFKIEFSDTSASWYIMDPSGQWLRLYTRRASSTLLLANSALRLQAVVYNVASSLSQKTLQIGGAAGMLSGPLARSGARRGRSISVTGLGTTLRPISSYRLSPTYAGPNSQSPTSFRGVVSIPTVTVVNDGNRGCIVDVVVNADLDAPNWTTIAGTNVSAVHEDSASTAFGTPGTAGGVTIASFSVAKNDSKEFKLDDLDLVLIVDQTITFAARSLSTTTDVIITPQFVEER